MKPKSPKRLTTKAFMPAFAFSMSVYQKADQAVAAEAHAFPAEEHHHEVAAHHQEQHGEDEEVEPHEEAPVVRLVRHVARRVDVDERRHVGDDHRHHHAQRVDAERELDVERAGLPHGPEVVLEEAVRRVGRDHLPERHLRHHAGEEHGARWRWCGWRACRSASAAAARRPRSARCRRSGKAGISQSQPTEIASAMACVFSMAFG